MASAKWRPFCLGLNVLMKSNHVISVQSLLVLTHWGVNIDDIVKCILIKEKMYLA